MRELAITLLEDEHGINSHAWQLQRDCFLDEDENADIFNAVKAIDGRWYLPEGWR